MVDGSVAVPHGVSKTERLAAGIDELFLIQKKGCPKSWGYPILSSILFSGFPIYINHPFGDTTIYGIDPY